MMEQENSENARSSFIWIKGDHCSEFLVNVLHYKVVLGAL